MDSHRLITGSLARYFDAVAGHVRDMILITDVRRRIRWANPSACLTLGIPLSEIEGRKLNTFFSPDDDARYTSILTTNLRTARKWSGELRMRKKDGGYLRLAASVMANRDRDGRDSEILFILHDTIQEQTSAARRFQSENVLIQAVESIRDGLCITDEKGRVFHCNKALTLMLGQSHEEIMGTALPYRWLDGRGNSRLRQSIRMLARGKIAGDETVAMRLPGGKTLAACVSVACLAGLQPGEKRIVVTFRDMSNIHHAGQMLRLRAQHERLLEDLRRKAIRLKTLQNINAYVIEKASVSQIFTAITAAIRKIVEHDLAGIYLYNPGKNCFVAEKLSKQTRFSRRLARFPLPLGEGIISAAALSGRMVMVNNAQNDPRSSYPPGMRPPTEHFIAVPLKGRNAIFGILVVARHRDPLFIEEEALVVQSFAHAATVALETARLYYELQKRGAEEQPPRHPHFGSGGRAIPRLSLRKKRKNAADPAAQTDVALRPGPV